MYAGNLKLRLSHIATRYKWFNFTGVDKKTGVKC